MNSKKHLRFLVEAALFAALYAALSYFSNLFGLSYGALQFRFSEALMPFAAFSPACGIGLTLGCFLSNLASPLGPVDWIFGTLATGLASLSIYLTRKVAIKGLPILAPVWSALLNGIVVSLILAYTTPDTDFWICFLSGFASIAISEFIVVLVLGLGLYALFIKIVSHSKGGSPS